jgi:hypothetical protein
MYFLRTESVFAHVPIKQRRGVDGHGAVQKNRQTMRNLTCSLELCNGVQHRLRTPHGKHRYHRHTTACGQLVQQGAEFGKQFFLGVLAVAIGGLDQHRVRLRWRLGRVHQRIIGAPQVTREQDAPAGHIEQQTGRTQNVTGGLKACFPASDGFKPLALPLGMQLLETGDRLLLGVQRQCGGVLGKAMPIGKEGVFFLDVPTVGQQDGRQIAGARGGMHAAAKAFLDQQR